MALDPATHILTNLALLLLLGLIISLISNKIKVSNILLLIISGLILGQIFDSSSFAFSGTFLVAIAVLTLVMVVFDGASRFELKNVNLFSVAALKVTLLSLFANIILITFFTTLLVFKSFSTEATLFSLLLAFVMSGTDPGSVFIMLKSKTNKVIEFLEVESIINTPFMVIFPFIIIDILNNLQVGDVASAIFGQIIPLLQQIVVGIGAGMVIGIVVFKTMKKVYSQRFSPVGIITAALLAYILAENLEGNGVLAVATLGIFFGNIYVKEKENLQEFNSTLGNSLIILVFILIGLIVKIELQIGLFIKALLLVIILILTRYVSLHIALIGKTYVKEKHFNKKEKLFMAFSMPKGIAAAVVAFSLSVFALAENLIPMMHTILQLIIIMMVYSLLFSSIIDRFSYKLIRIKLEEGK